MTGKTISVLILAAGSSSRMGQPKQFLAIEGQPLLVKSVQTALSSRADSVLVVLGHKSSEHADLLKGLPVNVLIHENWQQGMGSTLKAGLNEVIRHRPQTDALLVMVCDQPELTTEHLNALIDQYKSTNKSIVASYYKNACGVPAIFDSSLFSELLHIGNHEGAKAVIKSHHELTLAVAFPGGEIDLDTPEDYATYIGGSHI